MRSARPPTKSINKNPHKSIKNNIKINK